MIVKKTAPLKVLAVRLDTKTVERIERIAKRRKVTVSELVREIVASGLKGLR